MTTYSYIPDIFKISAPGIKNLSGFLKKKKEFCPEIEVNLFPYSIGLDILPTLQQLLTALNIVVFDQQFNVIYTMKNMVFEKWGKYC